MSAKKPDRGDTRDVPGLSRAEYQAELHDLQVEFVKLKRHFIGHGDKILVLLEGRDSAGKDGNIKRIVAHLSPRDTRVRSRGAMLLGSHSATAPDRNIVFEFTPDGLATHRLAP